MHTCSPPDEALEDWLENYPSTNKNFGHLLLQQTDSNTQPILEALRPYFESAHLDAREIFHSDIGIDLHPDANEEGVVPVQYPNFLHSTTQRGLFGEVMAGLVTENYNFVGNHNWLVPIFLFRFHEDARNYLFNLARNPTKKRQSMGRLGSDFIGISLDEHGAVERIIAGEAKWRKKLSQSVVDRLMHGEKIDDPKGGNKKVRSGKGIWNELNNDPVVPHGVRQLAQLLEEHDPIGFDAAILSMQSALVLRNSAPLPRTDLVIIVGNAGARRKNMECFLPFRKLPSHYTAGHDLQLVEVFLNHGEDLIEELYKSLWSDEADDA